MARTINLRQGKLSATPQTAAEPAAPAAPAAAGPKMPPKLGRPVTGKKPPADTPPVPAAEVPAPAAPAADLSFISAELESVKHRLDEMEKRFGQLLDNQLNGISTLLEELKQSINNNVDEDTTILHDVVMQKLDPDGDHGLTAKGVTLHAYVQDDGADSGN